MNKKQVVFIVLFFFLVLLSGIKVEFLNKSIDWCVAPYGWSACEDWTTFGVRIYRDEKFIAFFQTENQHFLWNGSSYDREGTKTLMIQSSFLPKRPIGECGGWFGICYRYDAYSDIFEIENE